MLRARPRDTLGRRAKAKNRSNLRGDIGLLEALGDWWRRTFGTLQPGACKACGEDARYGGKVCKACLKAARRIAREESGKAQGARGRYATLQGFAVRSEGEATIADHLFKHGVLFQYEPHVGPYRPDFLVPHERVIIEYYGMKNAEYAERRRKKEAYYEKLGYRVVAVRRQDLSRIGETLKGLGEPPAGLKSELKRQRDLK